MFASALQAQWPASASPFVPAGHWSYALLRRLDDRGLLPPGSDVARVSIPQEEIAALLAFAAQTDSVAAARYLRLFREEFSAPNGKAFSIVDFSGGAGYRRDRGRVYPGIGYGDVWTGVRAEKDTSGLFEHLRAAFVYGAFAGAISSEEQRLTEAELVVSGARVGGWLGRKPSGYATAHSGAIVLTDHTFDGGGVFLAQPINLPALGAVRFEAQLSSIGNVLNLSGQENHFNPYFWSARFSFEPAHWLLRVGINRGMMFGGEGNRAVTVSRLFTTLFGINTNHNTEDAFANQVFSVDGRLRIPLRALPSTLYVDWGADDAAGGWYYTPGFTVGLESAPMRADLIVGVERTDIAVSRRYNGIWYQNAYERGGWADDGVLLGSPLGGAGAETRAFVEASSPRGVSARLAGYARNRWSQNLFAPQRIGRSVGASGNVDARVGAAMHLSLQAELEHGTDSAKWTTSSLRVIVRRRF